MLDALSIACANMFQWNVLLVMLAALPIGILVGLLPGISGISAFTFLIPFTFGADPIVALAFLMTSHAAVSQGGSITAILFGVPGEVANAATIPDGHAMAKRGQASEAIGAALAASALGGLFGCFVLALMLPVLQAVVLAFQSPENFLLSCAGILFIATLAGKSLTSGILAGCLGIFIAGFGYDPIGGIPRFWLGNEHLLDGFNLVTVALGLFAIPEIVELFQSGKRQGDELSKERTTVSLRAAVRGVRAAIAHWRVVIQSAVIGTIAGIIPGAGSSTAPFLAYSAARQSSRERDTFGTGNIEGVIAPESSSNAKEGGSLVPTLALGIPGGSAMAMLLGAFVMLGLQPGPEFLVKHLDIGIALAVFCAVGNILASIVMFLISRWLVRATSVPGPLLAPPLVVLVVVGAYSAENSLFDVFALIPFGILGLLMAHYGYSRPGLLLGFVLGQMLERYFFRSLDVYGGAFIFRPISLAILCLIVLFLLQPVIMRTWKARRGYYEEA